MKAAIKSPEAARPVMYQAWRDLLFAHWATPIEQLEPHLPPELTIDIFDNRAWVGIVPFFMEDIRPRGLPAVPWLSRTAELNLRTYVRDRSGRPGVWFFSLDAANPIAVWLARTFFHLPYFNATIETARDGNVIDYRVARKGAPAHLSPHFQYRGVGRAAPAAPGSLEYFLVERYRLFSQEAKSGRLYTGRVAHEPYQIQRAEIRRCDDSLFALDNLPRPERPPDHVCYAAGVAVDILPLEPVPTRAAY